MSDHQKIMTLDEFTIQQLRLFPHATGELSGLLRCIGLAAKRVKLEVSKAGLVDILGEAGTMNVQGETVQKLDEFANKEFIKVLRSGINCAGVVSEEDEHIILFDDPKNNLSKYVLLMDPLDGSGNIDINNTIGTIFSVYRRTSELGKPCQLQDFLQPGSKQVAAGYIIYGSSTMLVYATKRSVQGFTLDNSIGEFYLSFANMKMPEEGQYYSFDYKYYESIDQKLKNYLAFCVSENKSKGRPYSFRYTGCMLGDVHRNLIKGGIFFYPGRKDLPEGKLRLMYECNPLAFITEVAGGRATNGFQRILEIAPTDIHQRTPIFIGSKNMMNDLEKDIRS